MEEKGPATWPAGAYGRAKALWIGNATPADICASCQITLNALYRAKERYSWPSRSRLDRLSAAQIAAIKADWVAEVSLWQICMKHSVGHASVRKLAAQHGWGERDFARPALPPGHPMMWNLINRGTSLEGTAFIR
jgi:hypothetical protein